VFATYGSVSVIITLGYDVTVFIILTMMLLILLDIIMLIMVDVLTISENCLGCETVFIMILSAQYGMFQFA
jgi:hypothetical protein